MQDNALLIPSKVTHGIYRAGWSSSISKAGQHYRRLVRKLCYQAKITAHRLDSLPTLHRHSGQAVIKAQFLPITRRISRSFARRVIMTPIHVLHIISNIHIMRIMHPLAVDEAGW